MIRPTKEEFLQKSGQGNLIPVVKEILADFDTPVSAYLKLGHGDYSFLLESVEENKRVGRYSFLGCSPRWIFSCKGSKINFQERGIVQDYRVEGNPLDELKKLMARYRAVENANLPRFFGGAVGYVGYGMVEHFEGISQNKSDDLKVPDACFMLADTLLAFDHIERRLMIIANAFLEGMSPEDAYEDAVHRIEEIELQLLSVKDPSVIEWEDSFLNLQEVPFKSNSSKDDFLTMVEKAKEYIRSGDIFQVVLSQRFCVDGVGDPMTLYRTLRTINPSPYMFLLKFKDFYLVGTSPEILVRCEKDLVEVRPIAGTRPRGRSIKEDETMEKDLLNDPKERAEHLMLVDLGRNDVGRVCKYGSIHVPELMVIEKYSHVMHIVSDVVGTLAKGCDAFDALEAAFPAGTVTGAPKIRAMQIIDELEHCHRGPYAGAIGYYSFSGDLDSCITIRTILLKDGKAYVQAGAGIVADSVPDLEYEETLNKARGMMKALAVAQKLQGSKGPKV